MPLSLSIVVPDYVHSLPTRPISMLKVYISHQKEEIFLLAQALPTEKMWSDMRGKIFGQIFTPHLLTQLKSAIQGIAQIVMQECRQIHSLI